MKCAKCKINERVSSSYCRSCKNEMDLKSYHKNKEKHLIYYKKRSKEKYYTDPVFRLKTILSVTINKRLKNINEDKSFQHNIINVKKDGDTYSYKTTMDDHWFDISKDQYDEEGYAKGYGKYAQDVLIPSFIAAYTGKEPGKVNLLNQNNSSIRSNPFSGMLPMPNWNLLYNGLAAIPGISNVFSNISLTHGYNGNLSMNSFSSSLLYVDSSRYGAPSFLDPVSKNYVPYFLIPNVTISERMEPLIGLNVTTVLSVNGD